MLSHLPRYENKYFNCVQSQIVSYCKHIGFPIDWLFYSSYEKLASLEEQFIRQNKSRWLYEGKCLSPEELSRLNITWHHIQTESFDEIEKLLPDILERGELPIITCNLYDLPYKKLHYQKSSVKHRFMYAGKKMEEGKVFHYVLDDNSSAMGDFVLRKLSDELLRTTFENSDKRLYWLTFSTPPEEAHIRSQVGELLRESVAGFPDRHNFLDEADRLLDDDLDPLCMTGGMLDRLVNAFTLLAGSRMVFSNFLRFYGGFEACAQMFRDCSLQAEIITNTLVKYKMSRRVNRASFREKCTRLQQAEISAQVDLKRAVLGA